MIMSQHCYEYFSVVMSMLLYYCNARVFLSVIVLLLLFIVMTMSYSFMTCYNVWLCNDYKYNDV